ncbi:MAG: ABC transporter ATP-binding protein, partial [OM182 bacterium MED-G24]
AADPDLWLLDEPTNHLDIPAIQWLEGVISEFQGTAMVISHDRRLLDRVATAVVDIDRGRVTRWDVGYQRFLERKAHELEVEARNAKLEDARLAQEEAWIREGIKARRTRNEGRVRSLIEMRKEKRKRRERESLNMEIDAARKSGKIVKELESVSKSFGDNQIVNELDLVIQRGDRIGLMGPNGTGKTTLIRTILGEESPDTGHVKTGTKLEVAYFDQSREQLDPDSSVIDCVSEGRDFITINGRPVHIITYLSNFMFSKDQARSPVRVLSGGEQNRILLAKLFMKSSNFMVLDEPTNDLDIETLEMLEELLHTYDGTVLVITHDRAFLDNVVGSMLVFGGAGTITEHVGGYSDWEARGGSFRENTRQGTPEREEKKVTRPRKSKGSSNRARAQELTALPGLIEAMETKISILFDQMADSSFYDQPEDDQRKTNDQLKALQSELETLFARWEELETENGS